MLGFIISLILIGMALIAIALRKTYAAVPAHELKRQARSGDELAKLMYRAVAYDGSLSVVLWTIVAVCVALSFIILSRDVPPVLAFILEVVVIGYGFMWMPSTDVTRLGLRLVIWLTPLITWFLAKVYPLTGRVAAFVQRHRPVVIHTGLYERDDLLALLERQKNQPDSRFSNDELSLLAHALTYSQKTVIDVMVPRRAVTSVAAAEDIGPISMKELYDSGHSRFPVFDGDPENIVGTLYMRDMVTTNKGGHVRDVMKKDVHYVHEDYSLEQVLHAFLQTKHHLFIVVNTFEEFVGIVTIEDILEQIIGHKIIDEFDRYDDMRAVAAHQAAKAHRKNHTHPSTQTKAEQLAAVPKPTGQAPAHTPKPQKPAEPSKAPQK